MKNQTFEKTFGMFIVGCFLSGAVVRRITVIHSSAPQQDLSHLSQTCDFGVCEGEGVCA